MVRFVGWLAIVLLCPLIVLAGTVTFTISTEVVGQDDEAPTTPVLSSVLPVASSQIDVVWNASVDNVMVSGYVVRRNGIAVATTTLTNYSDTGLLPETLYEYEVYAFDPTNNQSSSSNALATTTLELPLPPPPATSTPTQRPATSRTIILNALEVLTTLDTATFAWQTERPSRYLLRFGRTDAYEGGYIQSEIYLTDHRTMIGGLEPGTTYLFELSGITPGQIKVVLKRGEFTTAKPVAPVLVPNVERLRVIVDNNTDVTLDYNLPTGVDIKAIKVVRNHLYYPRGVFDGAVVYEGLSTRVFDSGALLNYSPQYYTVFVIAENGAVSSGAIIKVGRSPAVEVVNIPGEDQSTTTLPVEPWSEIKVEPYGLAISAIQVKQGGQNFTWIDELVSLVSTEPFTLSIPYQALPTTLKSINVTLLDPTDQRLSYAFLLRLNADRSAYEATLAPLNVIGTSRFEIEIFDYEQALVGRYRLPVNFVAPVSQNQTVVFPDALVESLNPLWLLLPLVIGGTLMIWWFLIWRRRKDEEKA